LYVYRTIGKRFGVGRDKYVNISRDKKQIKNPGTSAEHYHQEPRLLNPLISELSRNHGLLYFTDTTSNSFTFSSVQ
jgi:hypothetical protein